MGSALRELIGLFRYSWIAPPTWAARLVGLACLPGLPLLMLLALAGNVGAARPRDGAGRDETGARKGSWEAIWCSRYQPW